jgi:hypothetical protein
MKYPSDIDARAVLIIMPFLQSFLFACASSASTFSGSCGPMREAGEVRVLFSLPGAAFVGVRCRSLRFRVAALYRSALDDWAQHFFTCLIERQQRCGRRAGHDLTGQIHAAPARVTSIA